MTTRLIFAVAVASAVLASGAASALRAEPVRTPVPPAPFTTCAVCHTISADGAHSMGPNLRGIVGKKAATRVGYAYSSALKRSNVIWDTSKLDQWLAGPGRMVPGTRMVQNVPNPVDRAAIVKYLSLLR